MIEPHVAVGEAGGDGSGKPTSKRRSRVVHVTFWLISANQPIRGGGLHIKSPPELLRSAQNLYLLCMVLVRTSQFFQLETSPADFTIDPS